MELIPMLRFWSDVRTGTVAGAAAAVAITVWRVSREGDLGWTVLGLLGGAVLLGAVLGLYLWRWVPKHWRKAEPMPEDAEIMPRGKVRWWALLGGLGYGFAAVGKAADDSVVLSGVLSGMVVGALLAFSLGISRLRAWQNEHGQELLQWRRGRLRNPCHYLRASERPSSGRFDRERDAALTH